MSDINEAPASATEAAGPPRWKIIGPGLVVAATGVGAADVARAYPLRRKEYLLLSIFFNGQA